MKFPGIAMGLMLALLALSSTVNAQTTTGQITGIVADSSGAVVSGAKATLIYDLTKQTREFTTDREGRFVFTGLLPGIYNVRVEMAAFAAFERFSITVTSQEVVDLETIRLKLGSVTDAVTVTGDTAHVQADSSTHAISLDQFVVDSQVSEGRNYLNLLENLPGAVHTTTSDNRGWQGGGAPTINGGPGQFMVTLDGVNNSDAGNANNVGGYIAPSPDAIAEVKVLTGAYTADYGSTAGGQMNVTIKNGTNRFHGSAFWEHRHEEFNANTFFGNKNTVTINGIPGQAQPRAKYRYQDFGGTIGGPLIVPGTNFNKSRTKLFFFFSEDYLHNIGVYGPNYLNMPTALEKAGNFSQTYLSNSTNTLILVHDLNGNPLPGNILPASSITKMGNAMMNLFPTGGPGSPNAATDLTGNRGYNSVYQFPTGNPREDRILRVDYNLGKRDSSYVRLIQDYYGSTGEGFQLDASGSAWGQLANNVSFGLPSAGAAITEVHTFTPTLINEFSWGINHAHQIISVPPSAAYTAEQVPALAAAAGTTPPSLFHANVLNIDPNISFGTNGAQTAVTGISALPTFGWDSRWPFSGTDSSQNTTDNVTWIKGGHTVKAGIYWQHEARNVSVYSTYNAAGSYWFGADSSNPYDTGLAYGNMLTSGVQAYGEDNTHLFNHARYNQVEQFITDNWKLSRRFTFDLGVRFIESGAITDAGNQNTLNAFVASNYSSVAVGKILFPICVGSVSVGCSTANKRAQEYGGVGTVYPNVRATQFDPASYGATPFSGMTAFPGGKYYNNQPFYAAPRIGMAWDMLGDGKMALRAGFGIYYDRPLTSGVDNVGTLLQAPPTFFAPIYYNQSISTLGSTSGYFSPQTVYAGPRSFPSPEAYDWNISIQRDLGKGLILDVAYVANVHHHGWSQTGYDANVVQPLTEWTPNSGPGTIAAPAPTGAGAGVTGGYLVSKYLDPTSAGGTGAFYSANLVRALAGAYPGYSAVNGVTAFGEGYYDALQVQLNKRFGRHLQFSSNYSFQKTWSYGHNQFLPDQLNKNVSGNQHAVNITFQYLIPDGTGLFPQAWRNLVTKGMFDGWNFSGVGAYYTGGALAIGCSVASAPIGFYTGTPTSGPGTRCQEVGSLWMPSGSTPTSAGSQSPTADPKLWFPFQASSFVLPPTNSLGFGDAQPQMTMAPGFENWDTSIYKEFRFGKEQGRAIQLRMTAFNIMNHFNPGNPNTSLTYNYNTGAQTNTNFGLITSQSGNPRRITLTLRLRF